MGRKYYASGEVWGHQFRMLETGKRFANFLPGYRLLGVDPGYLFTPIDPNNHRGAVDLPSDVVESLLKQLEAK